MEHLESTIYCEKHPKVHQILCYPCLDRQYSQFHCISFGYNNGNNSELFILAPVTISKSTLDFTLNSGYNIVVSGCGEAWYRAWFGSKRPRVQIPTLRPYRVFIRDFTCEYSISFCFDTALCMSRRLPALFAMPVEAR